MDFDTLNDRVQNLVSEFLDEMTPMHHDMIADSGLDPRALSRNDMYVNPDVLAVTSESAVRQLNYYGGFEYVDSVQGYKFGEVTFYRRGDNGNDRVSRLLDNVLKLHKEVNEEIPDEDYDRG